MVVQRENYRFVEILQCESSLKSEFDRDLRYGFKNMLLDYIERRFGASGAGRSAAE